MSPLFADLGPLGVYPCPPEEDILHDMTLLALFICFVQFLRSLAEYFGFKNLSWPYDIFFALSYLPSFFFLVSIYKECKSGIDRVK